MALSEIERETYNQLIGEQLQRARSLEGTGIRKKQAEAQGYYGKAEDYRRQLAQAEASSTSSYEVSRRASETLARSEQIKRQNVLKEDNDRTKAAVRISIAARAVDKNVPGTARGRYSIVEEAREPLNKLRADNRGLRPLPAQGSYLFEPDEQGEGGILTSRYPTLSAQQQALARLRARTRAQFTPGLRPSLERPALVTPGAQTAGLSPELSLGVQRRVRELTPEIRSLQLQEFNAQPKQLAIRQRKIAGNYEGLSLFGVPLQNAPSSKRASSESPLQLPQERQQNIEVFGQQDVLYNPYADIEGLRATARQRDSLRSFKKFSQDARTLSGDKVGESFIRNIIGVDVNNQREADALSLLGLPTRLASRFGVGFREILKLPEQVYRPPQYESTPLVDNQFFKVSKKGKLISPARYEFANAQDAQLSSDIKQNPDVKFLTTIVGIAATARVLRTGLQSIAPTAGLQAAYKLSLGAVEKGIAAGFGTDSLAKGIGEFKKANQLTGEARFSARYQASADVGEGLTLIAPAAVGAVRVAQDIGIEALSSKPPRALVERNPDLRQRAAIIVKTDKGILLTEESPGVFGLPGGGIGKRERARSAAVRELFEETGLRVQGKPKQVFKDYTGSLKAYNIGGTFKDVSQVFVGTAKGTARARAEVGQIAYYKPGKADQGVQLSEDASAILNAFTKGSKRPAPAVLPTAGYFGKAIPEVSLIPASASRSYKGLGGSQLARGRDVQDIIRRFEKNYLRKPTQVKGYSRYDIINAPPGGFNIKAGKDSTSRIALAVATRRLGTRPGINLLPKNVVVASPEYAIIRTLVKGGRRGDIYGFHATTGNLGRRGEFLPGKRAEKGFFVAADLQPLFLRLSSEQQKYSFSLLPDLDFGLPRAYQVFGGGVKRLPRNIRTGKGFDESNLYIQSQQGNRQAILTRRVENYFAGRTGRRHVRQGTPEPEVIYAPGTRFENVVSAGKVKAGIAQRLLGSRYVARIAGRTVLVPEIRVLGSRSRRGIGKEQFEAQTVAGEQSLLAGQRQRVGYEYGYAAGSTRPVSLATREREAVVVRPSRLVERAQRSYAAGSRVSSRAVGRYYGGGSGAGRLPRYYRPPAGKRYQPPPYYREQNAYKYRPPKYPTITEPYYGRTPSAYKTPLTPYGGYNVPKYPSPRVPGYGRTTTAYKNPFIPPGTRITTGGKKFTFRFKEPPRKSRRYIRPVRRVTPSLIAIEARITGTQPRLLSGLELRPIPTSRGRGLGGGIEPRRGGGLRKLFNPERARRRTR